MSQTHTDGGTEPARACAITMVHNETSILPRWLRYYGGQLGVQHLVVIDDNSTDGSTDHLPCSILRLPPAPWKQGWAQSRRAIVNSLARAMLQTYDAVVFVDTDEFLVPDPEKYAGLLDYITRTQDRSVLAGVGLNVLHDAAHEPPIDPALPVLAQRGLAKFAPRMCKPAVKREPVSWMAGTHGIQARFSVDPDLVLFHLKYHDEGELRRVAQQRHEANIREGRGGKGSAWTQEADALTSALRRWVSDGPAQEAEPRRLRLPTVQPAEARGYFRVPGNQLRSMEAGQLLQIPERFRKVEF
jgi:hypothetical protein